MEHQYSALTQGCVLASKNIHIYSIYVCIDKHIYIYSIYIKAGIYIQHIIYIGKHIYTAYIYKGKIYIQHIIYIGKHIYTAYIYRQAYIYSIHI